MKTKRRKSKFYAMITISCLLLFSQNILFAQAVNVLNLDSCYAMAEKNYPLVKQYALIEKSKSYSIDNVAKGYLPQFALGAQASYQSDVATLPIEIPNLEIPTLSRDQYRVQIDLSQSITDIFTLKHQKAVINLSGALDAEKLDLELYQLKTRINQIYFGILLIEGQIEQAEILIKDIQSGIEKTNIAIANGAALKSSLNLLKAEYLKAEQRIIELNANRKGYINVLSLFINKEINELSRFETPFVPPKNPKINRPELSLFETQKDLLEQQTKLINDKTLPRFSLFVQGGYGKPGLDILNKDLDWYYMAGMRLNWNLTNFYTFKKEKKIISLSQKSLDIQKETFLFNTGIELELQTTEIEKLENLIQTDKEIIALRENVKKAAQNQLEQGIISSNDYLSYINAEDLAKQSLVLHQIQILMARYEYKTKSGN